MPTSVHIPNNLLLQADKRAKALGISRNRLIVRALERELQQSGAWDPEFFARLRSVDEETASAVEEMKIAIRRGRQSKPPTTF